MPSGALAKLTQVGGVEGHKFVVAFHRLSIGAPAGMGWEGGPFRCKPVHGSFGQAIAINLLQGSTLLDQMQRCLVLMLRIEAGQLEPVGDFLPGGWQELILSLIHI